MRLQPPRDAADSRLTLPTPFAGFATEGLPSRRPRRVPRNEPPVRSRRRCAHTARLIPPDGLGSSAAWRRRPFLPQCHHGRGSPSVDLALCGPRRGTTAAGPKSARATASRSVKVIAPDTSAQVVGGHPRDRGCRGDGAIDGFFLAVIHRAAVGGNREMVASEPSGALDAKRTLLNRSQ